MKLTFLSLIPSKTGFIQIFPYLFLAAAFPFNKVLTSIGVILILLAWIVSGNWFYKRNQLITNKSIWLLSAFFLINFVSLFYSEDTNYGGEQIVKYLSLIIFPIVCGSSVALTRSLKNFTLKAFVCSCFFVTIYCLVYAFYRNYKISEPKTLDYSFEANFGVKGGPSFIHWDYFSYKELISVINLHPTYFSMYLVVAIFYLIDLLDKRWQQLRYKKFLILLLIFHFTLFLFLLSARIIIVTFILLLFLYLFRSWSQRFGHLKSLIITLSVVLVTLGLIYTLPITRFRLLNEFNVGVLSVPKPNEDVSTGMKMRLVHWHSSIQVIKQNPLFGTGVGDFKSALDSAYKKEGYTNYLGFNSHNQFLQTLLSTGLIGLFCLFVLFYTSFRVAIMRKDGLYFCFLILFFITSLTESLLQSQKGIVFFAFFNCLFFFDCKVVNKKMLGHIE